jgi:hypothetical protein
MNQIEITTVRVSLHVSVVTVLLKKVITMDMPPTVQTMPHVLFSEVPSNNGLFQLIGSAYLAIA